MPPPPLHPTPGGADIDNMSSERLRGTSIVWRFAITSLVVFALIGIGIGALRSRDLRARSEESATVRATDRRERDRAAARSRRRRRRDPGVRYDELSSDIEARAMEGIGIQRVKIWNRAGS